MQVHQFRVIGHRCSVISREIPSTQLLPCGLRLFAASGIRWMSESRGHRATLWHARFSTTAHLETSARVRVERSAGCTGDAPDGVHGSQVADDLPPPRAPRRSTRQRQNGTSRANRGRRLPSNSPERGCQRTLGLMTDYRLLMTDALVTGPTDRDGGSARRYGVGAFHGCGAARIGSTVASVAPFQAEGTPRMNVTSPSIGATTSPVFFPRRSVV